MSVTLRMFSCSSCGCAFRLNRELARHQRVCGCSPGGCTKSYFCPSCDDHFELFSEFITHMHVVHNCIVSSVGGVLHIFDNTPRFGIVSLCGDLTSDGTRGHHMYSSLCARCIFQA